MCRKLIVLTSFVLMFSFVSTAGAIQWTGLGSDNLWSNPANWEGNKVPTAADEVYVEVPGAAAPNGPLIQDGINAEINLLACELAGEPTITMTGGTLTITGWGIWWGDGPGCNATFTMSGGTMTLTGGPGIHEFAWGGASGTWIMTGGEVFAKGVTLTTDSGVKGELLLHGGTYHIGTARGGLNMTEGNGLIDITEGTLILEGDETVKINGLIAEGKITAHGGTGEFEIDFDGRNAGMTTVTAVWTGKASTPDPADGAIYRMPPGVSLSWVPHEVAASHNVYIGDDFDSVNNGTGGTSIGNQTDPFFLVGFGTMVEPRDPYPDGLVSGTTYYWRVDEVEADGVTVHKGDVWSFTVPPKTAIHPDPADGAEFVDLNVQMSWVPGLDALFHTVYLGDDFDAVSAATGGTQRSEITYSPTSPLDPEKVYYWRVDESDASTTYQGDVWTFTTPGAVGNPQPANGATGVQMVTNLAWTPADNATSHQLYLGTDKDAVRNATTASPEYLGSKPLGSESHDPETLAWNSDYFWRVDAVYADPANPVKGPIWSFMTADFITVNDFESYNDINPGEPGSNRILEAWADGFGTADNGALVGNELPPYAEQAIVHSGVQSMPYSYDNNLKYSEATLALTYPTDWTEEGVGVLSLWFRGAATNAAEPMYVAVNGVIVNHDNANATQATNWEEWVIPLQTFADLGVDLTNVTSIAIGFGTPGDTTTAGGSGKMYFDDIKLYRPDPLVHHWTLDADGTDSAGGLNGTVQGATVVPSMVGNGLLFDGQDDSVEFTGFVPTPQGTVVFWMNAASVGPRGRILGSVDQYEVYVQNGVLANQFFAGGSDYASSVTTIAVDTWYHVAMTYDLGSALQQIYINGQLDADSTMADDPWDGGAFAFGHRAGRTSEYYGGILDDVRYYDKVLTMEEIQELMN